MTVAVGGRDHISVGNICCDASNGNLHSIRRKRRVPLLRAELGVRLVAMVEDNMYTGRMPGGVFASKVRGES